MPRSRRTIARNKLKRKQNKLQTQFNRLSFFLFFKSLHISYEMPQFLMRSERAWRFLRSRRRRRRAKFDWPPCWLEIGSLTLLIVCGDEAALVRECTCALSYSPAHQPVRRHSVCHEDYCLLPVAMVQLSLEQD